jgi:hypothetical protein
MPVLDAKFFQGNDPIPPDILSKLFVDGPTRVNEIDAAQLGWDGKLAGGIVLQLSEDGSLARRGAFTLLGQLAEQPVVIPAFKIWDKASKDLTATITLPKAEDFSFLDGGLCSDYIDEDEIQFAITKGHTPVLPPQYRQHKITGLALRMLAHLARGSNGRGGLAIKLTLLGFPLNVDELRQEGEATQSAAWAGIRLFEAECSLFPLAPLNSWGCPIYPLLHRVDGEKSCTASNQELQFAMGAVMGTACNPTACTNTTALKRFWTAMAADPEKAVPTPPHITWPLCERPAAQMGKY